MRIIYSPLPENLDNRKEFLFPRNCITRGIFRPSHSEQPQFTDVNEDCEEKRNAKITLLDGFF